MKLFIYISFITLLFSNANFAADLEAAKTYYDQGKYEQAVNVYQELAHTGAVKDSVLFYNIGNSYYKLNEFGKSRAYYLKALRIEPRNQDIKHNLELVDARLGLSVSKNYLETALASFSLDEAAILVFTFFLFTIFLSLFFYIKVRKGSFSYFLVFFAGSSLIIFIFITLLCFLKYDSQKDVSGMVINKASLLAAPNDNATVLFEISEGFTVNIDSKIEEWVKITFKNEYIGWIKKEKLMEL